jgi:hypothetical protein
MAGNKDRILFFHPSAFIPHPSSLIPHPSSFLCRFHLQAVAQCSSPW